LTVLVTSGESVIADSHISTDGTFDLEIPEADDLVVTIFGQNGVLRRCLGTIRGGRVDLGAVEVPFLEFPPGIDGQAWDPTRDRPVMRGVADLRLRGTLLASRSLESGGEFIFTLTRRRLLLPGTYEIGVTAPGYRRARCSVDVTDNVTSYRLGQVELTPTKHL